MPEPVTGGFAIRDSAAARQEARGGFRAGSVYVISVAAELAGMHPQTLRIYERKGLVDPARTSGGSRRYSEADIAQLRRIQELTGAGVNLEGVRRILTLEAELARLRHELEGETARLRAELAATRRQAATDLAEARRQAAEEVERTHRQYRRELVPVRNLPDVYRVVAAGTGRPFS
jgi:MerR family transcriptional regulator/heat shock protein HspR